MYNTDVYNTDVYNTDVYNTDVYNTDVCNTDVYNTDVHNTDVYNTDVSGYIRGGLPCSEQLFGRVTLASMQAWGWRSLPTTGSHISSSFILQMMNSWRCDYTLWTQG